MSKIVNNDLELRQDLDRQEMENTVGGAAGLELGLGMANTLMMRQIASSAPEPIYVNGPIQTVE